MLEQIQKLTSIYDLFALFSSYILNSCKKKSYEFKIFPDSDYSMVEAAIITYKCEKEQRGHRKAIENLKKYLVEFMNSEINIEKCFAVVKYIDEYIEMEMYDRLIGSTGIIEYVAINQQYLDQVRILPNIKETLLTRGEEEISSSRDQKYSMLRKRRKYHCSSLDENVLNYIIWGKDKIDKYPMKIYRLTEKSPIYEHFCKQKQVVFGIVPITNKSIYDILDIQYDKNAFYVNGMRQEAEEELKSKYLNIFDRCNNIDFLIFPEMLMTEDIICSISEKKKVNEPQIIINGSIWRDYINKSIITDGKGNDIFSYCKKETFELNKGNDIYTEYLDKNENKEYSILEIDGVGRIGIAICKDLINEDVKNFHKHIGTSILIVPAYTPSLDLQSSARELAEDYHCVVVLANACSALAEKMEKNFDKRIGFIAIPAKTESDRTAIIKMYYMNECRKECNKKCIGKKITIDFFNVGNYNGTESYLIKESNF